MVMQYSTTEFYHQYNDAINPAMYGHHGGQAPVRTWRVSHRRQVIPSTSFLSFNYR